MNYGVAADSGRCIGLVPRGLALALVMQAVATLGAAAQAPQPATRLMGFADFSYTVYDKPKTSGFVQGQLVGHLVSELGDRMGLFGEVSATAIPTGYRIEVERLILRYDFRDALKLSAGRYHTPISYWNTAFHHGSWLQTSVGRPEMIRGGGTFLPVHYVGLLLEGTIAQTAGLSYVAGLGNGRSSNAVRAGDEGEAAHKLAYNGGLNLRPASLHGAQFGGAFMVDRPTTADGARYDERIASAHFALERASLEILAEHAWVGNRLRTATAWQNGTGWYVQLGVRPPVVADRLKPYARLGKVDMPSSPIAPTGISQRSWVGGVRYDFAQQAALKLEYRRERTGADRLRSLTLSVSYTFPGGGGEQVATASSPSDHHD